MKNILLLLLLFGTTLYAQFGEQQVITDNANAARAVYSVDIDNDGDMDVLSASFGDNKVAWYKNLDGLGAFGEQQIIAILDARALFSSDIDGDGDMDVIASSFDSSQDPGVYWIENTDGLGNFGNPKLISANTDGATGVHAADLDNDGDIDVLSASGFDNKVAWYENTNGLGTFGVQQILTTNALSARTVYAADLDNDGDMDVVSASTAAGKVIWFKNTENGNFDTEQIISDTVGGVVSVYAEDMDGDGDMDVLSASYSSKISWHENIDGLGTFNNEHIISEQTQGAFSVHAEDLDNDGDMDVLSASAQDNKIAWYENIDSQGTFGEQQILDQALIHQGRDVFAADLDGDGDMDVLAASQNNHKILWYENFTILAVEENQLQAITLSPNPANNTVFIASDFTIRTVQVYDTLGRMVLEKNKNVTEFTVANLSSGLLVVKIMTAQGFVVKKLVKK